MGNIARMWDRTGAYKVLVGKPEGNRPLGRLRRRWKDNIKIDYHEVGWGLWTGLICLRILQEVGTCKRGKELSVSINSVEFLD